MNNLEYTKKVVGAYLVVMTGIALGGFVGLYSEFSRHQTPEDQKPLSCEQVLECKIYESVKSKLEKLFE